MNNEAVHFLYNTPARGPDSIGCMIDMALRIELKASLRWGNPETEHAYSLAKQHPARAAEIAKNIIRLRAEGKFDNGSKFT